MNDNELDLDREMDDSADEIRKERLKDVFDVLQRDHHAIYTLLMGLPKENIYLRRYYDVANNQDGLELEYEQANVFSLKEFFNGYEGFHPEDPFGFYFNDGTERIDVEDADEYCPAVDMSDREDFTVENFLSFVDSFLECYCETCLRHNQPLDLTPEIVARFCFTAEDVEKLKPTLDKYNRAARNIIWAEYDELSGLDFIRENRR